MLAGYLPILVFLGIATGIGLVLLGLGFLLGGGESSPAKPAQRFDSGALRERSVQNDKVGCGSLRLRPGRT